jgi:hypothetical protein
MWGELNTSIIQSVIFDKQKNWFCDLRIIAEGIHEQPEGRGRQYNL